ncbi:MAG: hypothetical protein NW237_10635 [Cyanobacteriota bacterium]|nr:hypothetical protein [Cyanobacteriota bacterium]
MTDFPKQSTQRLPMERELINIIEYLALGQVEQCLSTEYAHQPLFCDHTQRQALMQAILNRIPPVYMWLAPDECPDLDLLMAAEQAQLQAVVRQEIERQRQAVPLHASPYSSLMTEVYY